MSKFYIILRMRFKPSLIFVFILLFSSPVFSYPEVKTYGQLLSAIREIRRAADPQNRKEKVREAWTVGKLMQLHASERRLWADYDAYLIKRLSEDLKMTLDDLRRMRRFARIYPDGVPLQDLDWWHYAALIDVHDPRQREELAARDEKEHWTSDKLQAELKKLREENAASAGKSGAAAAGESHRYAATVTRVLDGDTFDAVVDLGFGVTALFKFRLRSLDAPELNTKKGLAAKEFLVNQLTEAKGRIFLQSTEQDKYGRWLAEVWIGGESLNQKLIDSGIAEPAGR